MSPQATSGRWAYGLSLTLVTCTMWGLLPIAMKGLLAQLDPYTISFYRFALAGACLLPFLYSRRQLPRLALLREPRLALSMGGCALLLIGNYAFYILALTRLSPPAAQVLIQLATVLFLLSGVLFFRERFSPVQWAGCLVFGLGLVVFFYPRLLAMLAGFDAYAIGMGFMVLSSISWASYATLQKQLLTRFTSAQVMLVIYALGSLAFLPWAQPGQALSLDSGGLLLLLFCGASTLIGSGCFAEAIAHWEASRISAVLATTPLFTLTFVWLLSLLPGLAIAREPTTLLIVVGALLVVVGAALAALGGRQRQA